jgi:eukaryotic-like serine/threonine-protein kinase
VKEDTSKEPSPEDRLNDVLLGYMEEAQAGQAPDRCQFLESHPELRPQLEEFFATHDAVERVVSPLRAQGDTAQPARVGSPVAVPGAGCAGDDRSGLGQLGDFRLLREVGRGGMGVVYEAEQISLRRRVALKVLPFAAAIDPRQLQRFNNEAMAAANLRHENIVPVYFVGSERGVHYYAMQFVDGQSLAALIDELRRLGAEGAPKGVDKQAKNLEPGGREEASGSSPRPLCDAAETTGPYASAPAPETQLSAADRLAAASLSRERSSRSRRYFDWVARLGRQVALALEHAHQMGITHRDIKPANLLLDARQQVWITDFGLARVGNDAGVTMTGEVLGTLRYASPEQALARHGLVDHRSDIYSLGATLYELITLRPVFEGRDRNELLRQIGEQDPQPPRALNPSVPVELETVILKALAKEPSDRYASAQELADDLERYLEDRPIRARRPSPLEKATKWARRHRGLVGSVLVALLLSLAGLSVATILTAQAYERERQKAHEADEQREHAQKIFVQAHEAVDQFVRISEDELAGNPFVERTRRRLLEAALAYYGDFIDQRPDDPAIENELAASQDHVKGILDQLRTLMDAGRYRLLHDKVVQKELNLDDNARQMLAQMDRRWHDGECSRPGPEGEKQRLDLAREQEANVKKHLTNEQIQRFKQIALQSQGLAAFREPEVIEALKLAENQRLAIRAIEADLFFAGEPFHHGPPHHGSERDREQARKDREKAAMENIQKNVLTGAQVEIWKTMIGKPSSVPRRPFPGFGGPPGPGRGPKGPPHDRGDDSQEGREIQQGAQEHAR